MAIKKKTHKNIKYKLRGGNEPIYASPDTIFGNGPRPVSPVSRASINSSSGSSSNGNGDYVEPNTQR